MKRSYLPVVWLLVLVMGFALVGCDLTEPVVAIEAPSLAQPTSVPAASEPAKDGVAESVPLIYEQYNDATRVNIAVALGANENRLRQRAVVDIGQRWSFGEQLGDIGVLLPALQASNGVLGGGWSDLAARYISAWEGLGLPAEYAKSGRSLIGMKPEQSPLLWLGEAEGNADVVLVNNGDKPVELTVIEDSETGQLTVVARVMQPKG
jgi:hypothetical protein